MSVQIVRILETGKRGYLFAVDPAMAKMYTASVEDYGEPVQLSPNEFELLETQEVVLEDINRCGFKTEHCCIYLALGECGGHCVRGTGAQKIVEARHAEGTLHGRRRPTAIFPDCLTESSNSTQ